MKNVREAIEHGFDITGCNGLANTETACGCGADDLCPCGLCNLDCEFAFGMRCPRCGQVTYFAATTENCKRKNLHCCRCNTVLPETAEI